MSDLVGRYALFGYPGGKDIWCGRISGNSEGYLIFQRAGAHKNMGCQWKVKSITSCIPIVGMFILQNGSAFITSGGLLIFVHGDKSSFVPPEMGRSKRET